MTYDDIIELIEGHDEISNEGAQVIIKALARKVPLEELDEPILLTQHKKAELDEIHTYICSITTEDAWTAYLWLKDAYMLIGHIPKELATIQTTFAHVVGDAYVERGVKLAQTRAKAGRLEEEGKQPPAPEDSSK